MTMKKSFQDLVPEDFNISLIWVPVDDLEDPKMEIQPYQGEIFHFEEIYLVAVNITLADGSFLDGYVRFSWGKPIVLALAINNHEFIYVFGERLMETEENHEKYAKKLNRKVDDVFPIVYSTKVKFYLQNIVY
jgi:hypothetical protein